MRITAFTSAGIACPLENPLSLSLDREMDAAADQLELAFALGSLPPELDHIRVEQDGEAIFYGMVDEQSVAYGGDGALLHLSARSMAACLLDNEAMVRSYENPTLLEIYKYHAKPHGIVGVRGSALAYNGTLTVAKGQSDWSVIAAYCRAVGGLSPRITPDRYLDVRLTAGDSVKKYSNIDADGARYSSLAHTIKRCQPVNEVLLKSSDGGTYQFTEQNSLVHGKGIKRRRMMEIRGVAGPSQRSAKETMRESNYAYEQYAVRALEGQLPHPGNAAMIRDARLGTVRDLVVAEVRYRMTKSGIYSDIVLIPARNLRI